MQDSPRRGRWYLILALDKDILKGCCQHGEDFVPWGLSVRAMSFVTGAVLSLVGTVIAVILTAKVFLPLSLMLLWFLMPVLSLLSRGSDTGG